MAETKWTKQQQSAIFHEEGALLVSAAAGSGKTAVLVQRAVTLITREVDPIPADKLLILTFTNAAAQELRARIGKSLEEVILTQPDNLDLRRQRVALQRAFMGTLDAFCQQLVKENFAALGLPPDIGLGDAAVLQQLEETVLRDVLEEMYQDENFAAFASMYGRSRDDKEAQAAILNLYAFVRTLPAPAMQLRRFAGMYAGRQPLQKTEWGQEMLAFGGQAAKRIVQQLQKAIETAGQEEALAAYLPALLEDAAYAELLAAAVEAEEWDRAAELVAGWKFGPFKPVRGYEGPAKEQVKLLRDEAKSIAQTLQKYCFICTCEEFEYDREMAGPMVGALCSATKLYMQQYLEAKLDEKVLDFADFEQLALELLQDENGARTKTCGLVSRGYSAVMVDEYQDTNGLQSALYECLGNEEGSNLFYVGDVKQSIYRFRLANPEIFLQKKNSWADYAGGGEPSVLNLGHNFRSGPGVIAGVNYLFSMLMCPEVGELAYTQEEYLIQGGQGGEEEGLELCALQDEEDRGDAEYVAARIEEMLRQGYMVREGDGLRPCQSGDFCILLRARAKMPSYVAALEAKGIPVAASGNEDILQTPEVLPVSAALCAIDNPGDDTNLAAAMLGPLFGFTPDDMVLLRSAQPAGGLWGAVAASGEEKCGHFVAEMSFYRAMAGEMPAGQLCEEMLNRTGYLAAVAAMEGGPARRDTLLRFVGWANEVSATGKGGLGGFVRLLQSGHGPVAVAAGKVEGRVNILTIHKSKGLEFPVCFLADAGRGFNTSDLAARVQMHARLGVGVQLREGDYLYPTLPAVAVRRRNGREALSEEMRILYVALTRAKEKIIVVFAHKNPAHYITAKAAQLAGNLPDAFLLGMQASFADWVTLAALCHPDADPLLLHSKGAILPRVETEGRFVMRVEELPPAKERAEDAFALTALPNEQLAKQVAAQFDVQSPRLALHAVPAKVSVTQLVKHQQAPLRRRPSFMYKGGLTAAEKGTAQHSFMQFANLQSARQNLEEEIARLVQRGYLQEYVAKELDRENIKAFLASGLCTRMLAAQTLLREYDFITAMPAGKVQPLLPPQLAAEEVMVQGIADAVLVFEGYAEIADYKTDAGKTPEDFVLAYAGQLQLYREAVQKRLGVPVNKLTIWAFALAREIDIPL